MTNALALLAVGVVGYFKLLEKDPHIWFQDRLKAWFGIINSLGIARPTLVWLVAVVLPAVGLPVVAFALLVFVVILYVNVLGTDWNGMSFPIMFSVGSALFIIFNVAVLMLTTAMGSFMTNHRSLIRAIYSNDTALATKIANNWERRDADVADSSGKLETRMLGLCVVRLHEDVIVVVLWYVLLGAVGAIFSSVHIAFERYYGYSLPVSKYFNKVSASVTIFFLGLCGNMAPALSTISSFNVERAALAASGNKTEAMDLKKVPSFGKLLLRTGLLSVVVGVIYIAIFGILLYSLLNFIVFGVILIT